jgi:hypothetical protein
MCAETGINCNGMTLYTIVGVLVHFQAPLPLNCKKPVSAFGGKRRSYFDVVPSFQKSPQTLKLFFAFLTTSATGGPLNLQKKNRR